MTGYRSGFAAGDRGADRRAEGVQADGRHGAAGVRSARIRCRLGKRGARRADARAVRPQARAPARPLRAEGDPRRGQRGDDVSLARSSRGRDLGGVRRAPARAWRSSSHPARISAPRARATSASRSCRRRPSADEPSRSSKRCCEPLARRGDRRGARQWRASRGEQGRRRVGRRRGGEGGDPRVLPAAQGRADDGRAVLATRTRSR